MARTRDAFHYSVNEPFSRLLTQEQMGVQLAIEAARTDRTQDGRNWGRAPMLLELGIPLNETHDGWPALTWSIIREQKDIFDKLIEIHRQAPHLVDIDSSDEFGWNKLMRAAYLGRTRYAEPLVLCGATRIEEAKALAVEHKKSFMVGVIDKAVEQRRQQREARAADIASGKIVVLSETLPAPRSAPDPARPEAPILPLRPRRG